MPQAGEPPMKNRDQLSVAFDMTFPNRNMGGSGVYARELLAELRRRDDLTVCEISGPKSGGLPGTLRWLASGARLETRRQGRSEEHTSELQSLAYLVCRLLLEKKNIAKSHI